MRDLLKKFNAGGKGDKELISCMINGAREDAIGSTLVTNVDASDQPTETIAVENTYVEESNTQMIDTTVNVNQPS